MDAVSARKELKVLVRLGSGSNTCIVAPFMKFKNKDKNYPLLGIPDYMPGATNRTGPKSWMDSTVMLEYLSNREVTGAPPNGRKGNFLLKTVVGIHAQLEYLMRLVKLALK